MALALAALLAPLLVGVVRRTKAAVAGRRGPPLLQAYRDLRKLLARSSVYSETTMGVFRAGPFVALVAVGGARSSSPRSDMSDLLSSVDTSDAAAGSLLANRSWSLANPRAQPHRPARASVFCMSLE